MRSRRITTLLVPLLLSIAASAQQPLAIRFRVVNQNRNVDSLGANDFVLLVDGVPQLISSFSAPGQPGPATEFVFLIGPEQELLPRPNPAVASGPSVHAEGISSVLFGALSDVSVAVYGYDSGLRRYCEATRDPRTFGSALHGALHVPYQPRYEMNRRPNDSIGTPLFDGAFSYRPIEIPSPGVRLTGHSRGSSVAFSWNEALLATLQDSAARSPFPSRIMIAVLGGLPSPDWDPRPVAEACRRLGVILYPAVAMWRWLAIEKREIREGKRERFCSPSGPGLQWKKLPAADKLSWLDQVESVAAAYESVGEQTGGRAFRSGDQLASLARMVATDTGSLYTIGYTPRNPDATDTGHRIEIRLRDSDRGSLVGGVREFYMH